MKRIIFFYFLTNVSLFLFFLLFTTCGESIPSEVESVVFHESHFVKPISVDLPCDDSSNEIWVAEYCNSKVKSGLYAAPIAYNSSIRFINKEFLHYLKAKKLVTVKNYSTTNSYGRFDFPVMIYSSDLKQYLEEPNTNCNNWRFKLARRKLVSIEYINEYEADPYMMGTKMKVFSLIFKYEILPELTNTVVQYEDFDGSAKAILNPDTGKWQLEELKLDKKESTSLTLNY